MLSLIFLMLGSWILWTIGNWFAKFRRNLQRAKESGIHYIPVPVHWTTRVWLITIPLCLPLLKKLPDEYTAWVDYIFPYSGQYYGHEIFERVGHDTFLLVAPGGITMHTCEPAVVAQVTNRRNDFPKPTYRYKGVDIYGSNVVSSEGHIWRRHRKATSPPFSEKNNQSVWTETIVETTKMVQSWVGEDGRGNRTIERVMDDTMRLSLHIISKVGFGRKLEWPKSDPGQKALTDKTNVVPSKIQNEAANLENGHSMAYTYAIHCLMENTLLTVLFPIWLLKWMPVPRARKVGEAYGEWASYMKEMIMNKRQAFEQGLETGQTDIIGELVKGQAEDKETKGKSTQLTDSEILGNLFVLMLAGHETTANAIHFALIHMALYPKSQRMLQRELDNIFQGRPPSEWSYQQDFPVLLGGMVGAVLNEELRLLPPVPDIPKSTLNVGDQPLVVEGKQCTVPDGALIELVISSTHRNARHWPTGPPTYPGGKTAHPRANINNDLEEFRPERWLLDTREGDRKNGQVQLRTEDPVPSETTGSTKPDASEPADSADRLYKPAPGVFVPFSDGARSCLGRRFAQIEVMAAIAAIFKNYSVELAVDKYASDEELIKMDTSERADVWQKAAEDARELLLTGLTVMITLQMSDGHVNLRFVPRGQELFPENVDDIWKENHPDLCSTTGVPTWRKWRGVKVHGTSR